MKVVVRSANEHSFAEQTTTFLRYRRINSQPRRCPAAVCLNGAVCSLAAPFVTGGVGSDGDTRSVRGFSYGGTTFRDLLLIRRTLIRPAGGGRTSRCASTPGGRTSFFACAAGRTISVTATLAVAAAGWLRGAALFCPRCRLAWISWDLNADQLLDRSQLVEFRGGTKRDRDPLAPARPVRPMRCT